MNPVRKKILSPVSILLIMAALMIMGAAMIPLLTIKLNPATTHMSLDVRCSWGGASSALMEKEVISKLEGALSRINGVTEITSVSNTGSGTISLTFNKGTRMQVARFEVASQIRYIYPSLPEGVSYPTLSLSTGGDRLNTTAVTYTFNTDLPGSTVADLLDNQLIPRLSKINGVDNIYYGGITPSEFEITVDADKARLAGIRMAEVASAFSSHFGQSIVGNIKYGEDNSRVILLKVTNAASGDLMSIPVKNVEGRIFRLGDLATILEKEILPGSYSRVNGLNTINLNIQAGRNSNLSLVCSEIRKEMDVLQQSFPPKLTCALAFDAGQRINAELNTIFLRTLATLAILLLFVFAVSRNVRYLLIIFLTLLANILVAIIFYNILGLEIHIYSLAGITVSLGIIIDTSIIMTDHYSYYHDRRAFTALLGAVLTTIAALSVVLLLPEKHRMTFEEFSLVIIVNLIVSLFISFLFIPSLIDRLKLRRSMTVTTHRHRKRVIRFNRIYIAAIGWGRRHRWIFAVLLVFGFGIPIHLLPVRIPSKNNEPAGFWTSTYNKTIGSSAYQENKEIVEKITGGAFRLFQQPIASYTPPKNENERPKLYLRAAMEEGNTVHQLNQIIRSMENYLSQFEEIELFRTRVSSYNNSQIEVLFRPEHENGHFPFLLYQNVTTQAIRFGGATWRIWGIGTQTFNNNISSAGVGYLPNRISLTGYNYDYLLYYAESLLDTLSLNRRVTNIEIFDEDSWRLPKQEFVIDLDREKVMMSGVASGSYFSQLQNLLYSNSVSSVMIDDKPMPVTLVSSDKDKFDLWNIQNNPLEIDSVKVKLASIGTIERKYSDRTIHRKNQNYHLVVAFDFVGSYELASRLVKREVSRLNDQTLPVGYKAENASEYQTWDDKERQQALLLVILVVALIYSICVVLFESWSKPLVIILLIPVSYIGVFLTFGLFGFKFNDGGFAAFVLLSGLVVNTGIYIVNEYNIVSKKCRHKPLQIYAKAYNRKIIPILLTILSTLLGLVPFLVKSSPNSFWFTFAVGTLGGMVFSAVAFFIYLPVFLPLKTRKNLPE